MDDINNLQTDGRIADILNKLKEADNKASARFNIKPIMTRDKSNTDTTTQVVAPNIDTGNHQLNSVAEYKCEPLPWFTPSDLDTDNIHFIKFDNSNELTYDSIPANKSVSDIALLKVSKDYVCDVDYYKSRHYVLLVKELENDHKVSNTYVVSNESVEFEDVSFIDDSQELTESLSQPDNDIAQTINDNIQYRKFCVFTDLGIATFVATAESTQFPYGEPNLSKWFEDVSNHNVLINPEFSAFSIDDTLQLHSCKYDIITMRKPGVIQLDSSDEQVTPLIISIKDDYKFIPLNRLLGCIKYYATHTTKTTDELNSFIATYFNIL